MKKIKYIVFDHDGTLVNTSVLPKSLYSGMKSLISAVRAEGVQLFVWTARNRRSTVEILESLGIISEFNELSCGIEAESKPSPEGIKNLLEDIDPNEVAVIGDSLGDIVGGTQFGARTFGALWGHGNNEASELFDDYGAEKSFVSVDECKDYFLKIIRGE